MYHLTSVKRDSLWGISLVTASLLFCGPTKASYTIINGRIVVAEGQLASMDMSRLLTNHRRMAHDLMVKAGHAS